MSIPRYQVGERVRLIVEGPVVHHAPCESPYPSALTIAVPMKGGTYQVTVPLVDAVTIERLTPDVQPGEVWQDATGVKLWVYRSAALGEVVLRDGDGNMLSWQGLHADAQRGPITRVFPLPDADGPRPPAPRLMLGDVWRDALGERWLVIVQGSVPGLTLSGGWVAWEEANHDWGPLVLLERAGYRRTTNTATAERLRSGQVVSHPDWVGGAPVRIRAVRAYETATYGLLGDRAISGRQALSGAVLTLWDEIAGGAR